MLDALKKAIATESINAVVDRSVLESAKTAEVKDMFLDDVDDFLDGAEDDPEIDGLVNGVPEYDEDTIDAKDLEALESIDDSILAGIPDTILTEEYTVLKGLAIGNAQIDDDIYETTEGKAAKKAHARHEAEESPDEERLEELSESFTSIEEIASFSN